MMTPFFTSPVLINRFSRYPSDALRQGYRGRSARR
jgi:hypothetical protein